MVSISLGTSSKLDKSGGTLTGPLVLSRDPLLDLEAATRQFVLAHAGGGGGGVQLGADLGGTLSAPLVLSTHLGAPLPLAQGGTSAADAPGARTQLGLGSAATQASSAFDAAGAASAALAAAESNAAATYVPLTAKGAASGVATLDGSGNLTAAQAANLLVAANDLSDVPDKTAARGNLGLGTAATASTSAFDAAGAASTAQTNAQNFAASAVATETTRATTAEALLAPLAGPALTGTPTAPTQTTGDNTTKIATDAFVTTAVGAETTRAQTAEALKLAIASNLSDVAAPAAARGNLAAAKSGANSDITSLTGLTTPLALAGGGTGQATQQAALNALAGAQTTARYLRGDGTNVTLAAIQAADVPTLNQSTTGTAAGLSATLAIAGGGTGATGAAAALANLGAVASDWCDMLGLGLLTAPLTDSAVTYQVTPGDLVLCLCTPAKTRSISTLGIWVTAAGATGSGTNALMLFSEAGVLIDQTGDMTTPFSSAGMAEGAMGGSHTVTAGTNYFLGFLTHFSGTSPHFAATGTTQTANFPVVNGHYTAIFKGSQLSVPSSFTPSSYTPNSGYFIMYGR